MLVHDLCRTILQQELADMDFGLEQDSRQRADVVKVTDADIEKVKTKKAIMKYIQLTHLICS